MKAQIFMEKVDVENKIRRGLKVTRFIVAYFPLKLLQWLTKLTSKNISLPEGYTRESVSANGINCEWFRPTNPNVGTVFYIHGGGFVFPASGPQLEMVLSVAKELNIRVLSVNYPLAPQNPFPAALEGCTKAYGWLTGEIKENNQNIVFFGDSAGGNLVLSTIMRLRDDNQPLPTAAICLSPVADFTGRENDDYDLVLHQRARERFDKAYVKKANRKTPYLSPLFGDWNDLPPILIHAGEAEILKADAIRIKDKAKTTNTEVEVEIYNNMWHVWQIFPELPQTKDSLDKIVKFLSSHI